MENYLPTCSITSANSRSKSCFTDTYIHLADVCRTLLKIHTFIEAQQEQSKIRQFFRQGEMSTLLKTCNTGLEGALEVFKVVNTVGLLPVAKKNAD